MKEITNKTDILKELEESDEYFEFTPSPELQKFCREREKEIEWNDREFERWGGWQPKLWYRMFYTIANKIYPHKPSQKESLYWSSPKFGSKFA